MMGKVIDICNGDMTVCGQEFNRPGVDSMMGESCGLFMGCMVGSCKVDVTVVVA